MAYGVSLINQQVLKHTSQSENSSQLDMIFFSDLIQASGPSGTSPAQGGVFYLQNANGGGSNNNNTAHFVGFGITASHGTCAISTGTTSNSTGYAAIDTALNILPGIPTPSAGLVTKYEYEALIRTDSTIFDNSTRFGYFRIGFMQAITGTPTDGVYFDFTVDGTTLDTTWNVAFASGPAARSRYDTGVSVAINKTYRMYLCVEVNSAGTYTTTFKIKNLTDNTNTEGTATPSNNAHYPSAATDYMGPAITTSKQTLTHALATFLFIDYIACRIRRPLTREILIFS